jgi:hypothetical protein
MKAQIINLMQRAPSNSAAWICLNRPELTVGLYPIAKGQPMA